MGRQCLRVLTVAVGLMGLMMGQPAGAYTILAPDSIVAGQPIVDWTAAWWTWALQAPLATNPLLDTTGQFAQVNNGGPVFFVGGSLGGPVTRSFNVPAGKPILLPLINLVSVGSIPPDPPSATLDERKTEVDLFISGFLNAVQTNSLFATIDGNPVADPSQYLEKTGFFDAGISQPGSLLDAIGVTAGTDAFPTMSGGYWLMIEGLTLGTHTLHFGGASDAFSVDTPIGPEGLDAFSGETTLTINVPEPSSALLLLAGQVGLLALRRQPTAA